jgi:hypothetical protein
MLQNNQQRFLSRQHERNEDGKERHFIRRTTVPPHCKDRITSGETNLIHCPTGIMIADFFTKPLQGLLFEKFRDIIMGITHCSSLVAPASIDARSVLDGDISEDSPRPIQARLAHDSKDEVSRSPLTRD